MTDGESAAEAAADSDFEPVGLGPDQGADDENTTTSTKERAEWFGTYAGFVSITMPWLYAAAIIWTSGVGAVPWWLVAILTFSGFSGVFWWVGKGVGSAALDAVGGLGGK